MTIVVEGIAYHQVADCRPDHKPRYVIDTRTVEQRKAATDHMKTLQMRLARLGNRLNPLWEENERRCELARDTFHELEPAVREEIVRVASSSPQLMLAITIGDWDTAATMLLRKGVKVAVCLDAHRANGLEERQLESIEVAAAA